MNVVTPGQKPQNVVQCERLCELLADGTTVQFERTTVKDSKGNVVSVVDKNLDGTPYTVVDPTQVGVASSDFELCKVFLHEKGTIANGVSEQYWETDGTTGNGKGTPGLPANATPAIDTIFTEVDECGILAHCNDPDQENVLTQAIPTDPSQSDVAHQSCLDYWVYVPKPQARLIARVNGWSSYAVYFGGCADKLQEVERGINTTFAGSAFYDIDLGVQPSGFFHVRTYSHDPGSSGKTILQWDVGNGPEDIPTENLFSEKPSAYCEDVWVNKKSQEMMLKDGSSLNQQDYLIFSCDPCIIDPGFPGPKEKKNTGNTVCLEDKAPTGEITNFMRTYVLDDCGIPTGDYTDTDMEGAPYTVSGIVYKDGPDSDCPAIWNRTYKVDDTGPVQLDLSEIDGNGDYCAATCAFVQNYGEGEIFITLNNGGEPNNLGSGDPAGIMLAACGSMWVGACKESPAGGVEDLANFKMIAEQGTCPQVTVTFFRRREA